MRFPDPKAVMVEHLAGVLDVPVASRVPDQRPERFVRVLVTGGAGLNGRVFSSVRFTVEAWATVEHEAAQLAAEAREAVTNANALAGHRVDGYTEFGPPVDFPDESPQYRYQWSFDLRFRPV